jgi:hypothetical protein
LRRSSRSQSEALPTGDSVTLPALPACH